MIGRSVVTDEISMIRNQVEEIHAASVAKF